MIILPLKSIIKRVLPLLDFITPKDNRLLVFGSSGGKHVTGNSKALFEHVESSSEDHLRCVYFTREERSRSCYRSIERISISTIWTFLRARTLLSTHGLGDFGWLRPSSRKHYIKLWHGRPGLKGDGYSIKVVTREATQRIEAEAKLTTYFLVCSQIEAYMRAYSHGLHARQILPLGYPRNDILATESDSETKRASLQLSTLPKHDFLILYAPTWRRDGSATFFPFQDNDFSLLDSWLTRNNAVLLLRPHPNDQTSLPESGRVVRFAPEDYPEISPFLLITDVLITDYSSIAADFLLLNRPIVYIMYDIEQFEVEYGSCYGDAQFWTPGPKVDCFGGLIGELENALHGNDRFEEHRRRVNRLLNSYQTVDSSERVYRHILRLLGVS